MTALALDLRTNPADVRPDTEKKALKRLEMKVKIYKAFRKTADVIGGTALVLGGSLVGFVAVPALALSTGAQAVVAASALAYALLRNRENTLKDRLKEAQKKHNPDAYYQGIIDDNIRIQKDNEKFLELAEKDQRSGALHDDSLSERIYVTKDRIEKQAHKIDVLTKAQSLARPCGKEKTFRRLIDAATKTNDHLSSKTHAAIAAVTAAATIVPISLGAALSATAVSALAATSALVAISGMSVKKMITRRKEEKAAAKSFNLLEKLVKNSKQRTE